MIIILPSTPQEQRKGQSRWRTALLALVFGALVLGAQADGPVNSGNLASAPAQVKGMVIGVYESDGRLDFVDDNRIVQRVPLSTGVVVEMPFNKIGELADVNPGDEVSLFLDPKTGAVARIVYPEEPKGAADPFPQNSKPFILPSSSTETAKTSPSSAPSPAGGTAGQSSSNSNLITPEDELRH